MNKLLTTLVIASFILTGVTGVFAADQDITVTIGEDINVVISPGTVEFDTVAPGTNDNPATNGPIEFDATGSNVDVNIEVTDVMGFPFEDGLMLDGVPALGSSWDLICTIVDSLCTYTTESTVPTLNVPTGAAQGINPGTITYTITGSPP